VQTDDILILFAELAVALAGFTGVVGALDRRGFSRWSPPRRGFFANLLVASFLALFWSVLPLVISNAGVAASRTWGLCSAIWVLVMIPANLMFWRHLRKHDEGIPLPAVAQTSALAIVVLLQHLQCDLPSALVAILGCDLSPAGQRCLGIPHDRDL